MKINAAIQAVDVRKETGQWLKASMLAGLVLSLMTLASGACVDGGTKFDAAVAKWDDQVKGSLDRLTALIATGVDSVIIAVKKDRSWFFGAVVLSMDIGVVVGAVNVSFTAVV